MLVPYLRLAKYLKQSRGRKFCRGPAGINQLVYRHAIPFSAADRSNSIRQKSHTTSYHKFSMRQTAGAWRKPVIDKCVIGLQQDFFSVLEGEI